MLHTDKLASTHELFAQELQKEFSAALMTVPNRKLTCLILDGEPALNAYSKILEVPSLRCDFHIYAQISRKISREKLKQQKAFIFGELKEGIWKNGILGSFDALEFDTKLEKIHGKIEDVIYNWIKLNRKMLIESSIVSAKLKAGHIVQYGTNNVLESLNAKLKIFIGKARSLIELIEKLSSFCEEELTGIFRAAGGFPDQVKLTNFNDNLTGSDLKQLFDKFYFPCSEVLSWKLPKKLLFESCVYDLARCYSKAQILQVSLVRDFLYIVENTQLAEIEPERFATVRILNEKLNCSLCDNTVWFCQHILRVLMSLPDVERSLRLQQLSKPNNNILTTRPNTGKK
uniref:Uncharacterized protein n=1 Tax=Caenorhabditis japonica TaxID=281687 RepID=A0A8R1HIW4_CAEJA